MYLDLAYAKDAIDHWLFPEHAIAKGPRWYSARNIIDYQFRLQRVPGSGLRIPRSGV